jgi:hypothetical protein
MNLRVYIDLRNLAELKNDKVLIEKVDQAYFDMNWKNLQNTVNIESGLSANQNNLSCRIFPNPAKKYVNIDLSSNPEGVFRIRIYDISGRVAKDLVGSNQNLKVSTIGMNSCFYYVLVESDKHQQVVTKLVVTSNNK